MSQSLHLRIFFVLIAFVIGFTVIIGKAFKVQVLDRDKLLARSKNQIFRVSKVYPKRGAIYDRKGSPLALNIQTFSIFTIPKDLKNKKKTVETLASIVPKLNSKTLLKTLNKRKRYTWIARKISLDKDQVQKVKDLEGVYIESVPKRLYPNHELASQLLGFVGVDNVGLSGIEYQFNEELKGKPRHLKYVLDAKGRAVKFESGEAGDPSKDVYLTIEKDVQAFAEKILKEAVTKHEAIMGGIGVMDVRNGEILAIANYPTFDPNRLTKKDAKVRKLAFVSDPFEPGSTFKTFTVLSALEHKVATPETNFYCERGRFEVEGHIISEAESDKNFEWLSVKDILKYSSNIGTTKIAFDLTYPRLNKTLASLRIGQKTGVEIPAESRGIYPNTENVPPLSLSNISFGQGIATTGIQMLAAYSAVANGGIYNQPTVIRGGNRKNKSMQIMSSRNAQKLKDILVEAVEDGTGGKAKIKNYVIAGKTSTAQRPDKSGGYSGHVPGFIGFPIGIKKPFVVYVYIDYPKYKNIYYGNTVAAPVFKKMTEYLLLKNKEFEALADVHTNFSRDIIKTKQSSYAREKGPGSMPDFVGLDKMSASRMADKYGLKIKSNGMGVVNSQVPAHGRSVKSGQSIKLIFKAPRHD